MFVVCIWNVLVSSFLTSQSNIHSLLNHCCCFWFIFFALYKYYSHQLPSWTLLRIPLELTSYSRYDTYCWIAHIGSQVVLVMIWAVNCCHKSKLLLIVCFFSEKNCSRCWIISADKLDIVHARACLLRWRPFINIISYRIIAFAIHWKI